MRKISGASHRTQQLEVYIYVGVAECGNLLASFQHYMDKEK